MPIFIMGAANEPEQLWMVDTDAGTVKAVDPEGTASDAGGSGLSAIRQLRRNGYAVTRDVDVAVLMGGSDQPVSRQFTE